MALTKLKAPDGRVELALLLQRLWVGCGRVKLNLGFVSPQAQALEHFIESERALMFHQTA